MRIQKLFILDKNSLRTCLGLWLCILASNCFGQSSMQDELTLDGNWELALDSLSTGPEQLTFDKVIELPGALEEASIGRKVTFPSHFTHLDSLRAGVVKKYLYIGKAWYQKEITVPSWAVDMTAVLSLERVIWKSTVYIDGQKIGSENSLSVPHRYDMTGYLDPGKHEILICIDNSQQYNFGGAATGYGMPWNGIRGELKIDFFESSHIIRANIFPDADQKHIRVQLFGVFEPGSGPIRFVLKEKETEEIIFESQADINPKSEYKFDFTNEVGLWDEFNPALYILESTLFKDDSPLQTHKEVFGFRKIEAEGKQLMLNGVPVFLRGTLGAGGGTDPDEWRKIFRKAKSYGLNHFRFHSHCPPEAAFEIADQLGVYLQVECPIWSADYGEDPNIVDYIHSEAVGIISEYGNHPSFLMFSTGNEMEGDFEIMNQMISDLKEKDNRFLYATTSFTFQIGHGMYPEPVEDFFVTQWTDAGWVRGQGYFDMEYPKFDRDYQQAMDHIPVPILTHEVGQHTFFPNLNVIDQYDTKSVYIPVGYMSIKNDLEKKGLLPLLDHYVKASGKLQVLLYKEEIERALKTHGIGGFQLLAIKDVGGYPIGMINDFWEPKQYIDRNEFIQYCSELVPLVWFGKPVYSANESFEVEIGVANFYKTLINQKLICEIFDSSGNSLNRKEVFVKEIHCGRTEKFERLAFELSDIKSPQQLRLSLSLEGTRYTNNWKIWVYPEKTAVEDNQVLITTSFDEAERALKKGRKVLLSPPLERIQGNAGVFITVFWAPTHFDHWERVSETGTMGLLIDPDHPAFSEFPTGFHSDWQWWDLCKNSQTMNYGDLEIQPLIRVIDNYYKNRKLTNLFEVKVGSGSLIFSSIDLVTDLENRIEAWQLRHSLIQYMKSEHFNPNKTISMQTLQKNFQIRDYWLYPAAKHRVIKRQDQ